MGCPRSRSVCETWESEMSTARGLPNVHSSQTNLRAVPYRPLMAEHPHRFYGSNDLHFLTFSCYHRQPFLKNKAYCDLFLKILDRVRLRYRLVVLGYIVMPEHVHLLVSEPQRETLSTVVQALKLGMVRSIECGGASPISRNPMSRKTSETWGIPPSGAPNRFWQARFYDFNVWTEKKRIEKLRYIHRNPVTRGLVAKPEQWPWTSFHWYLRGEPGPVAINDTNILVMKIRPPAA
jgi:putative transposase